jgi:D-aminopeptidase
MLEIEERGSINTPVYLCGTHAVGAVHHAAMLAAGGGPGNVVLPVVGECDDTDMADARTVTGEDVQRALDGLGAEVPEGSVGAGTGMTCFGFPGGIGTASRFVDDHHVGVLLLCNFGDRQYLDVLEPLGLAAGRAGSHGSCIAVCATDAPLAPHQLRRLALRPLLGIARAGSYAAQGSGEIGLAFTTSTTATLATERLNGYFAAAYEAAREAVYNCLIAARPATRLDGSMQDRFPVDAVRRRTQARA